jgi:hypothetical protein
MAAMRGRDLRAEARIAVREKGLLKDGASIAVSLTAGDDWFPCMVHDMSDSGFQILCSKELSVGQVLDLRCELFPGRTLNCRIEVRHISSAGIGTKVVAIDDRGRSLLKLYLEEQYSLKLNSKR